MAVNIHRSVRSCLFKGKSTKIRPVDEEAVRLDEVRRPKVRIGEKLPRRALLFFPNLSGSVMEKNVALPPSLVTLVVAMFLTLLKLSPMRRRAKMYGPSMTNTFCTIAKGKRQEPYHEFEEHRGLFGRSID